MERVINFFEALMRGLTFLSPLVNLAVRIYVGCIFWRSGLVKIASIDSTIWLFENEYHVPVLSPVFAAYLSTWTELIFSALLIIGLFGRFSAFVLFIVNLIAVLSYPSLMAAGVEWHLVWGLLLLVIIFHGPGKISCDHFIWGQLKKRFGKESVEHHGRR
ncbi:putative transmembrane protein [Legionella lansingensis]|uniref:Putative transmembrane protein n=1 Tax=Legionella lansingensis TaxID=45067 RepID=A0A0W0VF32_9GAMM|nr:DoxX family protein [Legionella lansingensis]KTD18756.1 putative transmembrane protein [Legionella lansingensis]SNV58560.1 putative transmembrane protein [Legionella lansingensis]